MGGLKKKGCHFYNHKDIPSEVILFVQKVNMTLAKGKLSAVMGGEVLVPRIHSLDSSSWVPYSMTEEHIQP